MTAVSSWVIGTDRPREGHGPEHRLRILCVRECQVTGATERWREVGDRVYVRRHHDMDLNVGLVVGEGACLVVDTRATWEQGRELSEAVRTVTPHPWAVVNTHVHFDHSFGNAAFRPASIWGHRRCVEALTDGGEAMRLRLVERCRDAGDAEKVAQLTATRIDPPDLPVDDTATLDVGGRPVVLRHLGRGHTDNDLVVLVPDADLLLAGDLVEEGAPPQCGDGFPLDWPATMDAMSALIGGAVVPGHGAVVDRAFVEGQRDELARLAAVARDGYVTGRPAADVARDVPYFGEFALEWVERAYLQLAAEKA
jgi:glyoxylase-like metal-dependent hydrolase (beta-lactamase superfamily II)